MEKISVIIPVYRTENYLEKCVKSVLGQTYSNLELILVDDDSPDGCPLICDEFEQCDKRIKVVHKDNEGLGLARNSGLEAATGSYVTFLDSDDWIDCDHIANLYNGFAEGIDLVIGSAKHCDLEGEFIKKKKPYMLGKVSHEYICTQVLLPMIAPDLECKSELAIPMSVCFNLYRLDLIKKFNLKFISERVCVGEDIFFNLEYLKIVDGLKFIDSYGYNYRTNPYSISRSYKKERVQRTFSYYNLLKEKTIDIEGKDVGFRIKRSTLSKIRAALMLISNSNMKYKEKYSEIHRILSNDYFKEIMQSFPIKTYRLSLRITSYCMKYRAIGAILLIFKIKGKVI